MAATGRIELRRDLTAKFDLVFKPPSSNPP